MYIYVFKDCWGGLMTIRDRCEEALEVYCGDYLKIMSYIDKGYKDFEYEYDRWELEAEDKLMRQEIVSCIYVILYILHGE